MAAKTAKKRRQAPPSNPAKPKEIDPTKLPPEKQARFLGEIHDAEKALEKAQARLELAKRAARAAKDEYDEAFEQLQRLIREQRTGPGPLYPVKT